MSLVVKVMNRKRGTCRFLHTSNPVYSNARDASFSNPWRDDRVEIASVWFAPEDSLAVGGRAVVGEVQIARFYMEVHLVPRSVGSCKKHVKKRKEKKDKERMIYSQQTAALTINGLITAQRNPKRTHIHRRAPWPRSGRSCLCGSHGCTLRWKRLRKIQTVHSACHLGMGRSL